MCNCCPPTVNALFCLWTRSGCSKASVAGALTFFPPDPPLYQFERYTANGNLITITETSGLLADGGTQNATSMREEEEEEEENDTSNDEKDEKSDSVENQSSGDDDLYDNEKKDLNNSRHLHKSGRKPKENSMQIQSPSRRSMARGGDNDRDNHDDTSDEEKKDIHPAQALTERALALRKRAKIVNERDAHDAANNITYKFVPDLRLTSPPSFSGSVEAVKIGPHPKTKNYIAALIYRIRPDRETNNTKTIIYSHGNATDIGAMYYLQVVMAKGLQCNVITYDYSGYGESGGVPLENNTYNDVEMVYDYALKKVVRNANEKNIIIYGQSVGSGPSCYICKKRKNVGGLILHSPFMSGMRVLTPSRALACLDIFPNINRIKYVSCPVMVIHGVLDQEVHISHGKALHDAVPEKLKRNPWWVRDRGHNDITDGRPKLIEYIQRLKSFFESLERS